MSVESPRTRWFSRVVLNFAVLLVLLPLIYMVGNSLKPAGRTFENVFLPFTSTITFENYRNVLETVPMFRYLWNSVLFSFGVAIGQLCLAVPAAFAFSYYEFPLKKTLLAAVVLSLMVPFVVTYVPNYLFLARYRLLNTTPGLVLPMLGISLGFGIFLLRQHFMSFPKEILEAAMIDGAGSWQILARVVTPANVSAVSALFIYILINTWNQFIWPLLIGGGRQEAYTLTVGVQMYFINPEAGNRWGAIMAASVLAAFPTVVIYLFMRKGVLSTFTEGAIKG